MDRRTPLLDLARQLEQSTLNNDWMDMARIEQEIAALLPKLEALGSWSESELLAVQCLREAHRAALQGCEHESAQLKARLADMCTHKDGRMAYALNEDWHGAPK